MVSEAAEVVITGIGVVLPGCDNRADLWRHLHTGEAQLRLVEDPAGLAPARPVGSIADFEAGRYLSEFPERHYRSCPRETQIYLASTVLARDDAKLELSSVPGDRVGLFDGTSRGNFAFWYDLIRRETEATKRRIYTRREILWCTPGQGVGIAAALLRIRGAAYTFTDSCSSGAIAIGHAFRELRDGEIDVAFAGGHEAALIAPVFRMYADAGLLSPEQEDPARAVRPFLESTGNAFGEGAVTLVMESRAHADRRGAPVLASVAGFEYGNNGTHPGRVDVEGVRAGEVLERLLSRSGTRSEEVGFVVGHGNGVHDSDASELAYMRKVFGARTASVPLISTKPIFGHTLGAAGAVNAAATALMLAHRRTVRTVNVDADATPPDLSFGADQALAADRTAGIAVSYGIGGHNSALLLKRSEGAS